MHQRDHMVHKFVLERCVYCNLPTEYLEQVGWECKGHSLTNSDEDRLWDLDTPILSHSKTQIDRPILMSRSDVPSAEASKPFGSTLAPRSDPAKDQSIFPHQNSPSQSSKRLASKVRLGKSGCFFIVIIAIGILSMLSGIFGFKETVYITPAIHLDEASARKLGMRPGEVIPALTEEIEPTNEKRGDSFFSGLLWVLIGSALLFGKYRGKPSKGGNKCR